MRVGVGVRVRDALGAALGATAVRRYRVLLGRVDQVDPAPEHGAVEQLVAERLVRAVEVGRAPALRAEPHLAHDDVGAAQPLLPDPVDHAHLVRVRARV